MQTTESLQTAHVNVVRHAMYARSANTGAGETRCSVCVHKDRCVSAGMTELERVGLDGLKFARRRVKEGEALYQAGAPFAFVYAVRTGTLKSTLVLQDGREQVSGFVMAGDLLGLDGLATGVHSTTAIALEDAEVCAIPYAHLAELGATHPRMHLSLTRLMSGEIVREHRLMMLLGSLAADERLATFLVDISDRLKARGYSPTEFHLRMSRADIGSYLGMTLETVSRSFSSFRRQRLLVVDKKHVRDLDVDSLRTIAAQTVH